MPIVLKAQYVDHVEPCIEIETSEYIPGTLWGSKWEYVYGFPKGNWEQLEFKKEEQVSFVKFLDVMVDENIDVLKLKIKLLLDENISDNSREIVNAIPIVDPTFIPPETNQRCYWQNQLLKDVCQGSVYYVIKTCKNRRRLKKFFTFLLSLS